jgi:hypothetical protein
MRAPAIRVILGRLTVPGPAAAEPARFQALLAAALQNRLEREGLPARRASSSASRITARPARERPGEEPLAGTVAEVIWRALGEAR